MIYKTAEHIESERKHLIKNRWQAVRTVLLITLLALISAVLISYSIKKESKIMDLEKTISKYEKVAACRRELKK